MYNAMKCGLCCIVRELQASEKAFKLLLCRSLAKL